MMSDELKPCPFCGGVANITSAHRRSVVELRSDGRGKMGPVRFYSIYCTNCRASSYYSDVLDEAVAFWNRSATGEVENARILKAKLENVVLELQRMIEEQCVRS